MCNRAGDFAGEYYLSRLQVHRYGFSRSTSYGSYDARVFLPLRRSQFKTTQLLLSMTIACVNVDETFEIKDVQARKPQLIA